MASGNSLFPPTALRDYAFLADGERGILVGPKGEMAWMCFPAWDSPSVFAGLLGGSGLYSVTPAGGYFVWGGYYDDNSLIWNDRWVTTTGIVECREALALPGRLDRAVILRRIRAVDGPARLRIALEIRADYDRRPMSHLRHSNGTWEGASGDVRFRWQAGANVRRSRGGPLILDIDLTDSQEYDLVLELSTGEFHDELVPADLLWEATEDAWRRDVPDLDPVCARRDAGRAYAVLRGLTSASGAMVAAATMALPERAEAGRNYDYRYAWIRDQCYAGQAVAAAQGHPLLDGAVEFVASRLLDDGAGLRPAYRAGGGGVPDEHGLDNLPGYPGGQVKVGNWVNRQFQLDCFGEALLLFATAARHDRLDSHHWSAVEAAVKAVESRWNEVDAGIWELDNRWWTHSRLTCVAGLRQIAQYATGSQAGAWVALADQIAARTASLCVHPSGRWQRAPDDARVDAALLLPAVRGATPPDDPRAVATVAAVERDLSEDGYLYRFRHDERPLHDAEGAFSMCGFVMSLAYLLQGRREDAVAWFERNRASTGSPGLLTEEFDVVERQLRGNLPQAFVHALLLETAVRLAA